MKKALLIILLILPILVAHAQNPPPKTPKDPDATNVFKMPVDTATVIIPADASLVYTAVEHAPEFPGGMNKFYQYLAKNIHYPADAVKNNIQGTVILTYVIERDGSLTDIRVARGVSQDIDAEAVRVVKSSPKWNPGMQNGKAVRVQYTVPINFSLKSH